MRASMDQPGPAETKPAAECSGCGVEMMHAEDVRIWRGRKWCLACAALESGADSMSITIGWDNALMAANLLEERAKEIRQEARARARADEIAAQMRTANHALHATLPARSVKCALLDAIRG